MKKIVIISGGANGLGLELVKLLTSSGYFVCNLDKDKKALDKLNKQNLSNYKTFCGDVSDENFVKETIKYIYKNIGNVFCLINNAGTPSFKLPTEYNLQDIDLCFEGLKGMILLSTNVLKQMEKTGGKIVNILSSADCEEISKKVFIVQQNGQSVATQKV